MDARTDNRIAFWKSVNRLAPDVARSLARVWSDADPNTRSRDHHFANSEALADAASNPVAETIREAYKERGLTFSKSHGLAVPSAGEATAFDALDWALVDWAHGWRLGYDWCLDAAVWTLRQWTETGGPEDQPEIVLDGPQWRSWQGASFVFGPRMPFRPDDETPAAYKGRVLENCRAALDDYVKAVREAAARLGPLRNQGIRDQHLDWLVEYHLNELSPNKIAALQGTGRTSVGHGRTVSANVKATARLLGITVRPPARGRPPGREQKRQRKPGA